MKKMFGKKLQEKLRFHRNKKPSLLPKKKSFRSDRFYKSYADYVEFLFSTGCRTGEVIGLCWKHLSDDCSTAWIGESFVRGDRKATKTNRDRTITLTPRLQKMIVERRPENFLPDDFVFKTPQGNPIDDSNFRNRAWTRILTKSGIDYRKPYNTRHTLTHIPCS